ncbi:imidazolonepropionase [Pedobacter alluvionis]|uniref:Imidazolonepropionase n=1 Tax=Pedobacter alluvionis TaxID=475253 RepID=A0A497Y0C6_9SPHI|nr:imidazolonepropionase [Pedobacter alluvionis]RLJ73500.1 imidazolonepropionase [Pedobacter alluvionis]TFB32867.1 imidazolonepropionase [Pedobacter alluvionis]
MLITNIKGLVGIHHKDKLVLRGSELYHLPVLENAWLLIEDGLIKDFGEMGSIPSQISNLPSQISAKGRYIFPSWCDSHTHIVFAASREEEFAMKIQGKTYEEIAAAGGGILNSANKLQKATEDELFESAAIRLKQMILQGTGAVEIKSGYGLTTESEIKMLRVIRRLKDQFPTPIKATFLAAHAFPAEFKNDHQGYINLIINEMLPRIAEENLADYIDVFCEKGFFSVEETDQILKAGAKYGLKPKIHANQLSVSGAIEVAVNNNAISVDHLEESNEETIETLRNADTIVTLLPSCSFYLGIPFADAKNFIKADLPIALATDYNPGSTPSGNMNFVVSLGCIKMKMFPEQAINAATLNGAAAMEISENYGSIAIGKKANLFITKPMPSIAYLPYSFGESQVDTVILNGEIYHG